MINELRIKNFKSHSDTVLQLKPLTVLTGLNGSGKTSVIQSLLLLRQSFKKQRLNEALILNDYLCNIGIGKDAIYQAANEDIIQFEIKAYNYFAFWKFKNAGSKDFLPLLETNMNQKETTISLFNNNFQYLSAGRLPEFKYERNDLTVENEKQISFRNGYGELVAQYLYHWGKSEINPALKNNKSQSNDLLNQVTAWEREISPNVNVTPSKIGEAYTILYSFDRSGSIGPTDNFKTENTAFGLTYALPVITSILSANEGSLLLIENPEAHLHPKGQSKIAELISLAAQAGIQIIIETHSDHIFNGIRKAVSFNQIKKENVSLQYFEISENNTSIATEIILHNNGRIQNVKKGFFDQFDNDLDELLGL